MVQTSEKMDGTAMGYESKQADISRIQWDYDEFEKVFALGDVEIVEEKPGENASVSDLTVIATEMSAIRMLMEERL